MFFVCFLFVLLTSISYFLFASYKFDETEHLLMGKYVFNGFVPYLDFFEHHGELLWYFGSFFYSIGLSASALMIFYKIFLFFSYVLVINLIINKPRGKLFFDIKNGDRMLKYIVSMIIGFFLSYLYIPDGMSILFSLLMFYFLLGNNLRDFVLAAIFLILAILSLQKIILAVPFLFLLTSKNIDLKEIFKKAFCFGGVFLLISACYLFWRYYNYSSGELYVVYESLFGANKILQVNSFELGYFFSLDRIYNLFYVLPLVFLWINTGKKFFLFSFGYIVISYLILGVFFDMSPGANVIRYLHLFLCTIPLFVDYNKFSKLKVVSVILIFMMSISILIATNSYNKLFEELRPQVQEMMDENSAYVMSLDLYDLNNEVLPPNDHYFVLLIKYLSLSSDKTDIISKYIPHLADRLRTYENNDFKYVYVDYEGCDYQLKVGDFNEALKSDEKPSIKCTPLVKSILDIIE